MVMGFFREKTIIIMVEWEDYKYFPDNLKINVF